MKVRNLLDMIEIIDQKAMPYDMRDGHLLDHYSESKKEYMPLLDMELTHLIRAYNKVLYTERHEL